MDTEDARVSDHTRDDALGALAPFLSSDEALQLNAQSVLELAFNHGRSLQTSREALFTQFLNLLGQRRALGLRVSGDGRYGIGLSSSDDEDTAVEINVQDRFASGAQLNLQGSSESAFEPTANNEGVERLFSTLATATLTQPILNGAGYTASHAELIQEERSLLYALRGFELARQDYAIEILEAYYGLIGQRAVLDNIRLNVEQSGFLQERSEAMFKVQMAPYIDVLRSQQQALAAETRLSSAEAGFETALRRFLVQLGVPPELQVAFTNDIPDMTPFVGALEPCVDIALDYRLEILTAENRLQDAERNHWVARNNLWPELNLFTRARVVSDPEMDFPGGDFSEELTAGLNIAIPFDQRSERDRVKAAEIVLAAADRNFDQQLANVRIDIIDHYNTLKNLNRKVEIERLNNEIALKRVRNAVLRFKNGELSNRDVVEAENGLLDARNALVQALIDHEIERLSLLRNMGLLDVTPSGRLLENIEKANGEATLFASPVHIDLRRTSTKSSYE